MGVLSGTGRGHAKLLLFGEHAAVYGHPAVGISLGGQTVVTVLPATRAGWVVPELSEEDGELVRVLLQRFLKTIPELPDLAGGEVRVTSDIPRGLGFGSSAALCAAVARALHQLSGAQVAGRLSPPGQGRALWEWSHRAEELFHGTPSGIDTGLALLEGLHAFYPHPPGLPDSRELAGFPLCLVVGAVPRRKNTGVLVMDLRQRLLEGDGRLRQAFERLGEISRQAIATLERATPAGLEQLAALAGEAHSLLASLGLGSPEQEELLEEGRAAGALAGKLSGAGGGGAFFLLAEGRQSARAIAARLRRRALSLSLPTAAAIRAVRFAGGRVLPDPG